MGCTQVGVPVLCDAVGMYAVLEPNAESPLRWQSPVFADGLAFDSCVAFVSGGPHFDSKAEELSAAIGAALGAHTPEEVRRREQSGVRGGASNAASARLEQLITSAPISTPSLHLIGEKDPARLASEANVSYYDESTRQVLVHPNDHMPPRQKEFAVALSEFAERWSPRERAAASATAADASAVPIA